MANIKILDTGYVSTSSPLSGQTQLSDANRAGYTGSAVSSFTLDTPDVSMNEQTSTENKPRIGTLTDSDTGLASVSNRVIKVSCILAKTETTTSWSTSKEYQFLRLSRTAGLKLLYLSGVSDTMKTIVEILGAINKAGTFSHASPTDDNGTIATTLPYLVGRVKNMSVTDGAKDKTYWKISFDFEVSG